MTERLPEQPIGDVSEDVVNRPLVAAALGRLTQEHQDVLRECYFAAARLHRPRMPWGSHPSR